MMRAIVLHGALGESFGREFRIDVASPAQAMRALMVQLRGFRDHVRRGHYRVTRVRRGRPLDLGEADLGFPLGGAEALHIVPEIVGAQGRNTGIGKVIAGVALVAAAVAAPYALGLSGGLAATIGSTSITYGSVAAVGLAVALSGIAILLTKTPMFNESFIFGGQDNVATQGGPVPLVHGGPVLVGSVTISAGLFTEALAPGTLPFNPATTPRIDYFSGS